MNTLEIYNSLNLCSFKVVFTIDRLPDISGTPSCFIANTDPSYKEGEHWVALYFDGPHAEYFDSYGLNPFTPFEKYLDRFTFIINPYCRQGLLINVCGQHCIYFLHHRAKGHSFEDIVEYLRNRNSDDIVADFAKYESIDQPCQHCKSRTSYSAINSSFQ